MMKPSELEQAVFDLEEVRIVVRASPKDDLGPEVFDYDRKAAGNTSISDWLEQRIKPLTNGHAVVVIDGTGALPHGRTRMEKLRDSYSR
jgi:hypothetical protein